MGKISNALFCKLCLFFFIVWHRRVKNRKTPKGGLTVLIKEDKELAELRGLAAAVGLANGCCAIRCVMGSSSWAPGWGVGGAALLLAHSSGVVINNAP